MGNYNDDYFDEGSDLHSGNMTSQNHPFQSQPMMYDTNNLQTPPKRY